MVSGRITEQNFDIMMKKTQDEQEELRTRVQLNKIKLASAGQINVDERRWVETIREYADIQELDSHTLHCLINEIVVHERLDQDGTRHIYIEIHFNLKPIPDLEMLTP